MNEKINGYYLDEQQQKIVIEESKYLLVVAGAGSGKTLTILGKINYLIKHKNIKPEEILCISFTKKSSESLKEKIRSEFNIDIEVYTFHKLSLEILKKSNNYEIAEPNLLENIVYEFFEETILYSNNHMKIVLEYFKVKSKKEIKTAYINFYKHNSEKIKALEKLLITFIHLLKCNNHNLESFNLFLKEIRKNFFYSKYKQEKRFLILALNIYITYEQYLKNNNEIDFDDMIIKATDYVRNNKLTKNYKYILIDEYQDTSYIRFKLIKEIINKTNANLMVVGDDFQSIYRFTGCDLSLFLNFTNYFENAKVMKIENTYRNSQELIKISGDFVMKNKKQIRKNLKSNKSISNPIQIIYYDNVKEKFKELIIKIYNETKKPILILSRNNNDINLLLDKELILKGDRLIFKNNPNIIMTYLTVHKSKGLEEETVIIINLEDNLLGFPNKIQNNRILRLVSKNNEKLPYSEERRLFYVALTRTKNHVYLLVPKKNKSVFIKEVSSIINRQNKKSMI